MVYTDNNPLTYVLTTAKLDAAGHRWVAALANYQFELRYKKGSENTDADALSRIEWTTETTSEVQDAMNRACTEVPPPVMTIAVSKAAILDMRPGNEEKWTPEKWAEHQRKDPEIGLVMRAIEHQSAGKNLQVKQYLREKKRLEISPSGLLTRTVVLQPDPTPVKQLLVPVDLRRRVLQLAHDDMGHLGRDRVLAILRERFWWPGMAEAAKQHLEACERCVKFKKQPEVPPLQPIVGKRAFQLLHVDFLHIKTGPRDLKKDTILLVVTDHFTRFAQALPTPNEKATTVAKALWEEYFSRFGFPEELITDQGKAFTGDLVAELCQLAGIDKKRTTPYHPQGNGACERFNATLLNMLGTLDPQRKQEWKKHVATLTHAYNCTRNSVTGYSPYELFYGRRARLPLDVEFGLFRARDNHPTLSSKGYVKGLKSQLQEAFDLAEAAERRHKDAVKTRHDRRTNTLTLQEGDDVLLLQPKRDKLTNRWEDTIYTVRKRLSPTDHVYQVSPRDRAGPLRTVNRRRLRLAKHYDWARPEQERAPIRILKRGEDVSGVATQEAGTTEQVAPPREGAPRIGPYTRSQARGADTAISWMRILRQALPDGTLRPSVEAQKTPATEEEGEVD